MKNKTDYGTMAIVGLILLAAIAAVVTVDWWIYFAEHPDAPWWTFFLRRK